MPLFDTINKAFVDANEQDNDMINRRKTKRISRLFHLHNDETNPDGLLDNPVFRQSIYAQLQAPRVSIESEEYEEDDDDLLEDRPKWENDYTVLIFMIGYATGLSNVWRFGYLCKVYGGIAFLIPYCFLTLVCAFPSLYLEMLIGQYAQVGSIASWKLCPLFKGVGMYMTLLGFMATMNIQSVMAWCLFYVFQSTYHTPLLWISCDNGFGKLTTGQKDENLERWFLADNAVENIANWHTVNCTDFFADAGTSDVLQPNQRLPGAEFFRGRVQRMWKSWYSDSKEKNFTVDNGVILFGLDKDNAAGGILAYNTDTIVALMFVYIVVGIVVLRGIKINSKFLTILVGYPYILLLVLFYRATGLRGAWEGLIELFRPDFSHLLSHDMWWKCAEQVFYSTGVGYGIHLTCASHNHFNRRIVYDAVFIVLANSLTSLISACTIFMFLGHVKVALNKDLQSLVSSGPQLAFEVMADILGVLPKSNFYAFCFYSFLFILALTTVSSFLICCKQSYVEVLPVSVKYKSGVRIFLVTVIFASSFVVSSLNLTRGGLHVYNYIETFDGLYSLIISAWFFLIGVSWVFGLRALIEAAKAMNIRCPGIYYQICWKFINPVIIGAIVFGMILDHESHEVIFDGREIEVGLELTIVGYIIAIGPFAIVIGGAIHALLKAPGKNFKEKFLISISPSSEHQDILDTGTGKRAKASHYFYLYVPTEGTKCNVCCSFHGHSKVAPEETEPTDGVKINITFAEGKRNSDPNAKFKEKKENLKDPIPKQDPPQETLKVEPEEEKPKATPTPLPEIKESEEPDSVPKQKRDSGQSGGSKDSSKKKKTQCPIQ